MPHEAALLREMPVAVEAPPPPLPLARRPARSAWAMPSFYLVPLLCACLFVAVWLVRLAIALHGRMRAHR
ncbi:hypothetical protein Q5H91_10240 [Sphingomonas sp. KR1UV-12]|uniref:Uncharacterized protein n=1 Tax=Sphingomonas aurea TaxID=3063994 RepID=A0ABT9EL77_9SPHN|nr:hypothetical protein [Sphingomonas sp. KR1UV-12]MDP1027592.1 hypothetical protein [Sphingomonas sp. KR1UV-12]